MTAAFGFLGLAHSVGMFWRHGGAYVSVPGIFAIGSATFIFFPAVYLYSSVSLDNDAPLLLGVACAYFEQIVLHEFLWRPFERLRVPVPRARPASRYAVSWGMFVGGGLLVCGIAGNVVLGLDSSSLAGAAAVSGAMVFSVAALADYRHPIALRIVLSGSSLLVYVAFMFTGGGRLFLAGVAMATGLLIDERVR